MNTQSFVAVMVAVIAVAATDLGLAVEPAAVPVKDDGGHKILDLRAAMNRSVYDDGIANNRVGGWTDEGMNDFHVWPEPDFGAKERFGYFFDFVNPAENGGRNLIMTGTDDCWPELPRSFAVGFAPVSAKFVFLVHSEGRNKEKAESAGTLTVGYADGTSESVPMRFGREAANWWQGSWWGNHEEILPDAPDALKNSGFNEKKYREAGGRDFRGDMLKYTRAVRWPVVRGINAYSANWNIPVVFWALRWENPHPEKPINSIRFDSTGQSLFALAAVTLSDRDFSLDRQTLGALVPPAPAPLDFYDRIKAGSRDALLPGWMKLPQMKGLKSVRVRSDNIITARVDQLADFPKLGDPQYYSVTSGDDPDFKEPVAPVKISRFSRASGYEEPEVFVDHFMHLELPKALKPGKHYELELTGGILPPGEKVASKASFSLEETPNPSFKVNQVGYSGSAGVKLAYLSSYLGDGAPVDISRFTKFEIRDAVTGRSVFSGDIKPHVGSDEQGLDKLSVLDLSGFKEEGRFYIWVDGLGRSFDFLNGDAAAARIYELGHTGLLFQRSGFAMDESVGGKWTRPLAHDKIFVTKENLTHPSMRDGKVDPADPNSPYHVPDGPRKIHGGHYDAGDFDLRPMHINVPELLMSLYEACPQKFRDGQVNIPEKNNKIPDILDEVAWNLLSLEYIQDYATEIRGLQGGVAPGMETYIHPGFHEGMGRDQHPYFMRKVTGYFSFCAAAAFAQAARVFKPFDPVGAEKYLRRARDAYAYAVDHAGDPQPTYSVGGGGPDQGEGWNARELESAQCWAAGQLYATTGEQVFFDEFQKRAKNATDIVAGAVSKWAVLWGVLGTGKCDGDAALCQSMRQQLLDSADKGVALVEERGAKGYRAAAPKNGGWGWTSAVVKNIEAVTRAYLLTKDQKYLDAIATSVDFTLGMNPSEMSWMTGAGTEYPMDPVNANSISDDVPEPSPGILIYGPTNYHKDNKSAFYPDKEKMGFYRRVVDLHGFPPSCEYSVWETQAPFLFGVGTLLPDKQP
jgi:endoglucanase